MIRSMLAALAAALVLASPTIARAQFDDVPDSTLPDPGASGTTLQSNGTRWTATSPANSLIGLGVTSTGSSTTLYVDGALGADANACTASGASACLTLQGAIDKIPLFLSGPVTINVAAGTYTENPTIGGRDFYKYVPSASNTGTSFIVVQGDTQTTATNITAVGASHTTTTIDGIASTTGILVGSSVTASSGNCSSCTVSSVGANSVTLSHAWSSTVASQTYSFSASGITVASVGNDPDSATAGVGNRTVTVTGAAWSTDQWRGYMITGTSGTGSGTTAVIWGNTGTVIEYVSRSNSSATFAANSVVKITSPSVTISGHAIVGENLGVDFNDVVLSSGSIVPFFALAQGRAQTVAFNRSQIVTTAGSTWSSSGSFAPLTSYVNASGGAGLSLSIQDTSTLNAQNSMFNKVSVSAANNGHTLLFQTSLLDSSVTVSHTSLINFFPIKMKFTSSGTFSLSNTQSTGTIQTAFVNTTLVLSDNASAILGPSYFSGGAAALSGDTSNGIVVRRGAFLQVTGSPVKMVSETMPVTIYDYGRVVAPLSNSGYFDITCTGTSTAFRIANGGFFRFSGSSLDAPFGSSPIASCTKELTIGGQDYTRANIGGVEGGILLPDGTGIGGENQQTQIETNFRLYSRVVADKPTCAAGYRGMVFPTAATTGIPDSFEVCVKDAADAYAWQPAGQVLFTCTTSAATTCTTTVKTGCTPHGWTQTTGTATAFKVGVSTTTLTVTAASSTSAIYVGECN